MPTPKDSKQIIFIGRFYDLFTSDPFLYLLKNAEKPNSVIKQQLEVPFSLGAFSIYCSASMKKKKK